MKPMDAQQSIPATLIPGDGIGPEITHAVVEILGALGAPFEWDEQIGGMAAIEAGGDPLPQATLDSIRRTKLALKGPLTTPVGGGFRSVNVRLREAFGLYANLRPARTMVPGGRYEDIDIVLVRENLEGLYVAFEHFIAVGDDPHAVAISQGINTRKGCERIIRFAFDYAVQNGRKKVTIVHKANVLKALTGIFLEAGRDVAQEYEDRVQMDDRIVDACAMQLVMNPWQFDVIVTTNLFGDILSDQLAGLVGGLGWRREPTSGTGRPSSRPCTGPRPTSRARASPTRSPCCSPPPSCSITSARRIWPNGCEARSCRPYKRIKSARAIWVEPRRPRSSGPPSFADSQRDGRALTMPGRLVQHYLPAPLRDRTVQSSRILAASPQ